MKKYLIPVILIYLAAIIQRSLFSRWGFGATGPQSPQLIVIIVFFLIYKELGSEAFWFVFFYFFFWEMFTGARFPGLISFVVLLFIWVLQKLGRRLLPGSAFSTVLMFVFINGLFYLADNFGRVSLRSFILQLLVNIFAFFIFYPVLDLIFKIIRPQKPNQLSLRI